MDLFSPIKTDPRFNLYMVNWISTRKCSLKCKHCYSRSTDKIEKELSTKEVLEMLDFFYKFDVRIFVFSGGEFILRPDWELILKKASELFPIIFIPTSGFVINEEVVKKFKEYRVSHCQVSIDSPIESEHDWFRGRKGTFKKAMVAIKLFKKYNIETSISPTIGKFNKDKIREFIKLARKIKCNIFFKRMIPAGRGKNSSNDFLISSKDYQLICKSAWDWNKKIKNIQISSQCEPLFNLFSLSKNFKINQGSKIQGGCMAGIGVISINEKGEISPCSKLQISLGKFNPTTFQKTWETSPVLLSLRNRGNLKGKCRKCTYKSICGGCRGYAYETKGDFLNEDSLCWR